MITLKKIENLARQLHEGQFREYSGKKYITHPINVSKLVKGYNAKATALLHDVLEDCKITAEELIKKGVNKKIVDAVKILTHDKSKFTYDEYIYNIMVSNNDLAYIVKVADLIHNMTDGEKNEQRYNRHRRALSSLFFYADSKIHENKRIN